MNTDGIRLRAGTSVGRTIYRQTGYAPSKDDQLIGLVDSPAWADLIVAAVNYWYETGGHGPLEIDATIGRTKP